MAYRHTQVQHQKSLLFKVIVTACSSFVAMQNLFTFRILSFCGKNHYKSTCTSVIHTHISLHYHVCSENTIPPNEYLLGGGPLPMMKGVESG